MKTFQINDDLVSEIIKGNFTAEFTPEINLSSVPDVLSIVALTRYSNGELIVEDADKKSTAVLKNKILTITV